MKTFLIFTKIFLFFTFLFFLLINLDLHHIFFYNGIISMIITSTVLLFFYIKKYEHLTIFVVIISFLLHFSIFLFIPVTVDRSISVNLLRSLNEDFSDKKIYYEDIQKIVDEYTSTEDFVSKRIEEQIVSKNIELVNNHMVLTNSGKNLVKLFEYISRLYGNN